MSKNNDKFKKILQYKIPCFKLCLVQEGSFPSELYPVRSPEDAAVFLEPLKFAPEEHFVSLHLNARHEVIGLHEVSHGTISSSLVHPREVFKSAILSNCHAILVCHNHPSGSVVTPSLEDIETTEQLIKASVLLGINLIDHLIISPIRQVYSLRENHPNLWCQTS